MDVLVSVTNTGGGEREINPSGQRNCFVLLFHESRSGACEVTLINAKHNTASSLVQEIINKTFNTVA